MVLVFGLVFGLWTLLGDRKYDPVLMPSQRTKVLSPKTKSTALRPKITSYQPVNCGAGTTMLGFDHFTKNCGTKDSSD